jgi:uncharacterized protein
VWLAREAIIVNRARDEPANVWVKTPGARQEDPKVISDRALMRRLARRLGALRVGTVDKFQGQEAPVVIFSMCASSGDASPREIEFLFSRNRLNVALSRAQTLAVIVGHPSLVRTHCSTIEQMRLLNVYCRAVQHATSTGFASSVNQC